MSKTIKGLLVVGIIFTFFAQDSYAFFWKKKDASDKAVVEQPGEQKAEKAVQTEQKPAMPQSPVLDDKEVKKERALRDKKRKQLEGSLWDVEMTPMSGKGKGKKDVLVFKENRFSAEKFSQEGFEPTNFTITVKEDGITVWETMQSSGSGKDIIFWRGEIGQKMSDMRGVVSIQHANGINDDFSFVSTNRQGATE